MSKRVRYQWINENTLYNDEEICNLDLSEENLYSNICTVENSILFAVKCKILKNQIDCKTCELKMSIIKNKQILDGYFWKCKPCKRTESIRNNTFFSNSNLSIAKIIKVLYKIVCGIKQVTIANDLNISESTVSPLVEKLRHLCIESIAGEDSKIGGLDDLGYPKVVEIDESLFFKRKYERGRIKNGKWYVAGIERGTNNSFIVPVDTRDSNTIHQIIINHIKPYTIIISDEWRAYSSVLSRMENMEHYTINHSVSYVDASNPSIHTNTIEGFFSHAKAYLRRKYGVPKELVYEYLTYFIWSHNKPKTINPIIILIKNFVFE